MEQISVVIPVYNRAEVFFRALESVAQQSYHPLEIIVVDDGSTENIRSVFDTVAKKNESSDTQFIYVRQENKGAPAARNRGFEKATGTYVIFWDADAVGNTDMLQKMHIALQENPRASFAYSNFLFGKKVMRGKTFSFEELKKRNYIMSTSLIRRCEAISWDETLKRFQDWDLWLTMGEQGKQGVWIDEVLFQIEARGSMSLWLPSFAYQAPFRWLPFFAGRVRKYEQAQSVVTRKHGII